MDPLPTNTLVIIIVAFLALAILIIMFVSQGEESKTGLSHIFDIMKGISSEEISLGAGHKALHISIDPADTPEIFEFHPTDEGVYGREHFFELGNQGEGYFFSIEKFKDDKCTFFVTHYDYGFSLNGRWNQIYYINPGTILTPSCDNLKDCLMVSSSGCDYVGKCSKLDRTEYSWCCKDDLRCPLNKDIDKSVADNGVLNQNFTNLVTDSCADNKEHCPKVGNDRNCCPLFEKDNFGHKYQLAYDIACGFEQVGNGWSNEAKWLVCNDDNEGAIITDRNILQFKCENYEWTVSYGAGIYIFEPKARYVGGAVEDEETELKFSIANYLENDITADVTVTITTPDVDCGIIKNDCKELTNSYELNSMSQGVFISKDIKCSGHSYKGFCHGAKTFDVDVSYDGNSEIFKLICADAKEDVWTSCVVKYPYNEYEVDDNIPIFSDECNSIQYKVFFVGVGSDSILVTVEENSVEIESFEKVEEGQTVIFNSVKVSLKDANLENKKALIGVDCV